MEISNRGVGGVYDIAVVCVQGGLWTVVFCRHHLLRNHRADAGGDGRQSRGGAVVRLDGPGTGNIQLVDAAFAVRGAVHAILGRAHLRVFEKYQQSD